MDAEIFFKLLQLSMSPVVLISAAALLLLSLTNRLGRTVDRARGIATELEGPAPGSREASQAQLQILLKRCRLLRLSVSFASMSILFSSLLILALALFLFMHWPLKTLSLGLFLAIIGSMITATIYFLLDVSMALNAVELDIQHHLP